MKGQLPKELKSAINRLANEQLRQEIYIRAKRMKAEYAQRLTAGESIEALTAEVHSKTIQAIAGTAEH